MSLEVLLVLGGVLLTSLLFNVFFIWYFRNLVSRLRFISENLGDLVEETISFRDHLESVHELEVFYGDETIGGLIRHVGEYSETLADFEEIYTLFDKDEKENLEETDVYDDERQNEGGEVAAITQEETQKTNKKIVFHSGP
tara:strand:- start:4783 stop:5205 length:423 start_codon:yes stop_codon:yes gene_type:complete